MYRPGLVPFSISCIRLHEGFFGFALISSVTVNEAHLKKKNNAGGAFFARMYPSHLIKLITIDSGVWRRHEAITYANSLEVDKDRGSWIFHVNLTGNGGHPFAWKKTHQFR